MTVPAGTAAIRSFTRPGLTLVIALSGLAGMSVCAVPARSSANSTLTVLGVPRQDAVIGNILAAPIRLRVRDRHRGAWLARQVSCDRHARLCVDRP
jgi:hypothetical protein